MTQQSAATATVRDRIGYGVPMIMYGGIVAGLALMWLFNLAAKVHEHEHVRPIELPIACLAVIAGACMLVIGGKLVDKAVSLALATTPPDQNQQ